MRIRRLGVARALRGRRRVGTSGRPYSGSHSLGQFLQSGLIETGVLFRETTLFSIAAEYWIEQSISRRSGEMIGQTLSRFKITGMLGEGGMGVVYRPEDSDLDKIRHHPRYKELVQQMESGT
jgi:hypothetical protein